MRLGAFSTWIVISAACGGATGSGTTAAPGAVEAGLPFDAAAAAYDATPTDGGGQSLSDSAGDESIQGYGDSSGPDGPPPQPPDDGRCDLTPRMIVSEAALPLPFDAGAYSGGVGTIAAGASDLYYTVYALWGYPRGPQTFSGASAMRVPLSVAKAARGPFTQ